MANKEERKQAGKVIRIGFFLLIGLIIFFGAVYTISAGERGVLLTFGKPSMDAIGEGLHFKVPFAQAIKKMEVRTQKVETSADSVTKDLQSVMTIIALNYHLNPEEVPKVYQELGNGYRERVIDPTIQESVKAIIAKYEIGELTDKRAEVSRTTRELLAKELGEYGIIVDGFNVINFDWSEDFKQSIEDKLTAEQRKLKAEMDLERIIVEKEQAITKAQAEAESLRLQKQEVTSDLIKLRQIEVQRLAIEKWDGHLPDVTGGAMPFLDVDSRITTTA